MRLPLIESLDGVTCDGVSRLAVRLSHFAFIVVVLIVVFVVAAGDLSPRPPCTR